MEGLNNNYLCHRDTLKETQAFQGYIIYFRQNVNFKATSIKVKLSIMPPLIFGSDVIISDHEGELFKP